MADKPVEAPSTEVVRVETYARVICLAEGGDPESVWPAGSGIKRWRWHIPAALAIIKEHDREYAEKPAS